MIGYRFLHLEAFLRTSFCRAFSSDIWTGFVLGNKEVWIWSSNSYTNPRVSVWKWILENSCFRFYIYYLVNSDGTNCCFNTHQNSPILFSLILLLLDCIESAPEMKYLVSRFCELFNISLVYFSTCVFVYSYAT